MKCDISHIVAEAVGLHLHRHIFDNPSFIFMQYLGKVSRIIDWHPLSFLIGSVGYSWDATVGERRGSLCSLPLSHFFRFFSFQPQLGFSSCIIISGGFRGGAPGARPPYSPKFSRFHAVFRKIWQNRMLAPPLEGWRPLLRGILDPPLIITHNIHLFSEKRLVKKELWKSQRNNSNLLSIFVLKSIY